MHILGQVHEILECQDDKDYQIATLEERDRRWNRRLEHENAFLRERIRERDEEFRVVNERIAFLEEMIREENERTAFLHERAREEEERIRLYEARHGAL